MDPWAWICPECGRYNDAESDDEVRFNVMLEDKLNGHEVITGMCPNCGTGRLLYDSRDTSDIKNPVYIVMHYHFGAKAGELLGVFKNERDAEDFADDERNSGSVGYIRVEVEELQ